MISRYSYRSALIFFLFLITLTVPSRATQTVIQGKAPSYAGEKLIFLTYSDMISFREIPVASCIVSDSGQFKCVAELEEIRLLFLKLGVYNCIFYLEPGLIYQLQLPQKREKSEAERMNPYFEEISIHLGAKPVGSTNGRDIPGEKEDLNLLIRSFNDAFHPYYYKYVVNAYMNEINQQEIKEAIQTITEPFADVTHPFFKKYMEYRLGLLNHYGAQQSTSKIINDYFNRKSVLYYNPAYMELFNEIFNNYFDAFKTQFPESNLLYIINREINLDKLVTQLQKEKAFANDTLLEMVLIKNLYDCFYKDEYSKPAILILMDSLFAKTNIAFHKSIISDIKSKITKLMTGSEPPPFKLYDKDSVLIGLDDFRGKYVYLSFCNSFSYYCIREFDLLKDIDSRHSNNLAIVTILVDDNYQSMRDLLKANNYNWTFLHYASQPEIIRDYEIKAYPTYYLIGPDGKLIASPAPSPLEGFEEYLFKTMRAKGDI
jgi:peroxiredoxin